MKKIICLLLIVLLLAGCSKNLDNIPALELIQENGEQWASEQLEGYSAEDLETVWGAAPWVEHTQGGYVWRVPGDWDEVHVFFEGEDMDVTYVTYSHIMKAEILEIGENQVTVKPAEGEWEGNSADQIVVNLARAQRAGKVEYAVGDIVLVRHGGVIQETYPAVFAGLCQMLPIEMADSWNTTK